MKVKKTERGWAGHYCVAHRCLFRRNTLLEFDNIKIVISTVGSMELEDNQLEKIGVNRYYETMAFHSDKNDIKYNDADVNKKIYFKSKWAIVEPDVDDLANKMHDDVVEEITSELLKGNKYNCLKETKQELDEHEMILNIFHLLYKDTVVKSTQEAYDKIMQCIHELLAN